MTQTATADSTTETLDSRIARLVLTDIGDKRRVSLEMAHPLVDDATFVRLSNAPRLYRDGSGTVILPACRFERLSRGKGWARQGRGDAAVWGERTGNGGYRVGSGRWVVGGNDGFNRKDETPWNVSAVRVGDATWMIAE